MVCCAAASCKPKCEQAGDESSVEGCKELCDQGSGKACVKLGMTLSKTKSDHAGARAVYDKGCKAGEPEACLLLGMMLKAGEGGPKNLEEAAGQFAIACKGKNAMACNELGVLYLSGEGVKRDWTMAQATFKRACDMGYQPGCENAAKISL